MLFSFFFSKSFLNEEVKRTESSPSVKDPLNKLNDKLDDIERETHSKIGRVNETQS